MRTKQNKMRLIGLTNGYFTIVDNDDFERVNQYKWCVCGIGTDYVYARRVEKGKEIKLHRFIMGIEDKKLTIDHIDHFTLNNQKKNLRVCSNSQNIMNRKRSFGSSQYIGVSFHKNSGLYHSSVYVNKKYLSLGYFKDEVKAAKERDKAARLVYGCFGTYNFPKKGEKGVLKNNSK